VTRDERGVIQTNRLSDVEMILNHEARTKSQARSEQRAVTAGYILFVEPGIDATNDDILDQMRIMKRGREKGISKYIVCTIRGFGDDHREIYEIPEVGAFCRRIVNLGFVSYLELTTLFSLDSTAE
jgi:hypothetical protein